MKFLLALIIVISGYCQSLTQNIIYLKSGQKVKGVIIDTLNNEKLRVKLNGMTNVNIRLTAIDSISKSISNVPDLRFPQYNSKIEIGRFNNLMGEYGYRFNIINGYDFSPYFFGGINFGYRSEQPYYRSSLSAFSTTLDCRIKFSDKNVSSYVGMGLGGILNMNNTNSYLFNPHFGSIFKINKTFQLSASIGYEREFFKSELKQEFLYFSIGASLKM